MTVGPTLAGFNTFVYSVMRIDPLVLPTTEQVIEWSYNGSLMVVNQTLMAAGCAPGSTWSIYTMAVYNLGGSNLINFAQDQSGRTFFTDMRDKLGISKFQPGIVSSGSDSGSSTSLLNPEFMRTMTMRDLQNLKDPWGRAYLAIAMDYGTPWGIS